MTAPSPSVGRAALQAEWTKIRTVRSTVWTLLLTFVISVGISLLIGLSMRSNFDHMDQEVQNTFDPVLVGFYSLTLGQLALVVFGVLLVSTEYTSGTIRASLAAMPQRHVFYGSKVLTGTLVALMSSVVIVFPTFFVAQWALGPHGTSLGADGVLRATTGACLYLTLMCAFSMGVAAMLRSTALSLGIMIPLLFLGSQGLGNVPGIRTFAQYLPDQAGLVMMEVVPLPRSSIGHRDFGPWAALAIMVTWVVIALLGGYLVLRRRDA
ncbi:MAG: transporter integral rane protein [Actinomycetia bacterium]|nr:transporter integral rane protein [Actinomycetes bacterium]